MISSSLRELRRRRFVATPGHAAKSSTGASPFEKGGMRGIHQAFLHAIVAKSPLAPLLQRGEHAMLLPPGGTP